MAGTDVTANLKLIADLRNTLGSMDHAVQVSEQMARLGVVLQAVTGKAGEEDAFKFARFLELRGSLIDPKTHQISTDRMLQQTRLGEAIIVGERGRVGPADMLAFQQQARGAGSMLSDQGLLNTVPLIQAVGGNRAGTMTAAITQSLVGGVMTQRSAKWLQDMGLLPKDAIHTERGGQVTIDKNRLVGAGLVATDQSSWVTTVLLPALAKKGITDQDAISKAILQSGLRQTATGGLIEYARNAATFEKEVANIRAALGVDQYETLFGRGAAGSDGRKDRDSYQARGNATGQIDPTTQITAFSNAWGNLLTALGGPLVQPAMEMLSKVTDAITWLGQAAAAHPDVARVTGEVISGVAGLGVVLGGFATGSAALSGLHTLNSLKTAVPALLDALALFGPGSRAAAGLDGLGGSLAWPRARCCSPPRLRRALGWRASLDRCWASPGPPPPWLLSSARTRTSTRSGLHAEEIRSRSLTTRARLSHLFGAGCSIRRQCQFSRPRCLPWSMPQGARGSSGGRCTS